MIHRLESEQRIPATLAESWGFFSDPRNLTKITPPALDFRIQSELPTEIHAGLMIEYRVRPVLGIPVTWLTEITHARKPNYFADEQRVGPYAIWHHEHHFEEDGDGVVMRDIVHYRLPFSPFSDILDPILVKPQLDRIFSYRREAVAREFG